MVDFRPVSGGYTDGDGGYSAVGWLLKELGIPDEILFVLKTNKPCNELRLVHGVVLFNPTNREASFDRSCEDIERYHDVGKRDVALILIGYVLRVFEDSYCGTLSEINYLRLRLNVAVDVENADGRKIFPTPLKNKA